MPQQRLVNPGSQLLHINSAVPRRARIQGSQTLVSLKFRLGRIKEDAEETSQETRRPGKGRVVLGGAELVIVIVIAIVIVTVIACYYD